MCLHILKWQSLVYCSSRWIHVHICLPKNNKKKEKIEIKQIKKIHVYLSIDLVFFMMVSYFRENMWYLILHMIQKYLFIWKCKLQRERDIFPLLVHCPRDHNRWAKFEPEVIKVSHMHAGIQVLRPILPLEGTGSEVECTGLQAAPTWHSGSYRQWCNH